MFSYRTYQKECPFSMKICASSDGNRLIIKHINENHNHELNKVNNYPAVTHT